MPPVVCPPWEYTQSLGYKPILAARAKGTLIRLHGLSPADKIGCAIETRPIHAAFFEGLTPIGFAYYAGHYRGEDFPCLRESRVGIQGDPLVGHAPAGVVADVARFASEIETAVSDADFVWAVNDRVLTDAEKLYRVVALAVALFVYFLQIHPYVNGNGHMARLSLIAFLSRFNINLARFPFNERPAPPYSELIGRYRRGDAQSLVHYVLGCI